MSVYNIFGHYGTNTCQITEIDDSRFRLQTTDGFWRAGGFSDEQTANGATGLSFIDPAGGPLISVGSKLNEYHSKLPAKTIVKIESNNEGITLCV